MIFRCLSRALIMRAVVCLPLLGFSILAGAADPEVLLQQLNDSPHVQQIAFSEAKVVDHEIGLGALRKVQGEWRFKQSERMAGTLISYTWQIGNGFTSAQVMETLLESVAKYEGASLLFTCDGRACGPAAQWANRVFHQRILFGREDLQRYRVYVLSGDVTYRMIVYAAARTAKRQYLHADLLRIVD